MTGLLIFGSLYVVGFLGFYWEGYQFVDRETPGGIQIWQVSILLVASLFWPLFLVFRAFQVLFRWMLRGE